MKNVTVEDDTYLCNSCKN